VLGRWFDGDPLAFDRQVEVDLGVVKRPHNTAEGSTATKQIAVSVRRASQSWNSRILSELEEQIERTRVVYLSPILVLTGLIVLMAVVFLLQIFRIQEDLSKQMWLDEAGLQRAENILKQNRTITDEELREITTIQLRNLVSAQQAPAQSPNLRRKLLFLGLPFLFLTICAVTLMVSYPRAVFLWGDEIARYNAMINRRKILWGFIFTLALVGLLSRFLYEGLFQWLPR